jgi:hypothetical protein
MIGQLLLRFGERTIGGAGLAVLKANAGRGSRRLQFRSASYQSGFSHLFTVNAVTCMDPLNILLAGGFPNLFVTLKLEKCISSSSFLAGNTLSTAVHSEIDRIQQKSGRP